MRLEEIVSTDAAENRVKRLKDNAKRAKEHAKQLKANADFNAERLKMKQSRQKSIQLGQQSAASTIKPYK